MIVSWTEQLTEQLQLPIIPVSCPGRKSAGLEAIRSRIRQWTKGQFIVVCGFENVGARNHFSEQRKVDVVMINPQSGRTTLARALQAQQANLQEINFLDSAHLIPANDADDVEKPLRILLRNKGPLQRKKEVMPMREY